MDSSNDEFAALRALLKLKRHEQPPPRFFDDLAHRVHQQLRGPDGLRRQSFLSLLGFEAGLKPALFFGLGVACSILALCAVVNLLVQETRPASDLPQALSLALPYSSVTPPVASSTAHVLPTEIKSASESASTNPVFSPGGPATLPIDGFRLRVTPVSYNP